MPDPEVVEVLPPLVQEAYWALGPWARADESHDLLWYVDAIFDQLVPLHELVSDSDTHVGWGKLLDAEETPDWALLWLAQFVGISLPTNASPEVQREQLLSPSTGWLRGTVAAVTAAVRRVLSGSKTVELYERVGDEAYRFEVRTIYSESPPVQEIIDEVNEVKPAGLVMVHSYGLDISEATTWAEAVGSDVYACSVPSDTLYPAEGLLPC